MNYRVVILTVLTLIVFSLMGCSTLADRCFKEERLPMYNSDGDYETHGGVI